MTISAIRARERLSTVINRIAFGKERVVLTRRGKEVAAVVPIEDVKLLEELEDRIDLEEARAPLAETDQRELFLGKRLRLISAFNPLP